MLKLLILWAFTPLEFGCAHAGVYAQRINCLQKPTVRYCTEIKTTPRTAPSAAATLYCSMKILLGNFLLWSVIMRKNQGKVSSLVKYLVAH